MKHVEYMSTIRHINSSLVVITPDNKSHHIPICKVLDSKKGRRSEVPWVLAVIGK